MRQNRLGGGSFVAPLPREMDGSASTGEPESPESPGAWPEEIDVSVYADSSLTIPGMGSPGKRCGEAIPVEFCDSCGREYFGISRCEQRQCPDCWTKWRKNRTEPIVRRLGAARFTAGKGEARRAVHAVVSPLEGEVTTLSEFDRMMRRAYDLAKSAGVKGGVAIPHGWRVKESARREWERQQEAGETDLKLWAWVRERPGDWRTDVYWSPHVHILGRVPDGFEADDPESQDGWVVRRIDRGEWSGLKPFRLTDDEAYEDMARVAMYLLSHAGFEAQSNTDAIRWFGEMHPSNFQPDPREGEIADPALETLSVGSFKVVERKAAEAVDMPAPGETGEGRDDPCENEDCKARSRSPIREVPEALQDREWCEQIGREQQKRLDTAFRWLLGEVQPPPGMKNPGSVEAAREAFEAILDVEHG